MGPHPGFATEATAIASNEHLPMDRARAILASAARKASPAARLKNPRLNRVKGRPFAVGQHAPALNDND